MFKQKFEITNPEAIKLINSIKSGAIFAPLRAKLMRYKWLMITGLILICLLIALATGKALFQRTSETVFTPPDIERPIPTTEVSVKSVYENLRQDIQNFSVDLPDPVIPPFDNKIDLEITTL